ncbi:MAG: hypothetical protein ACRYFZ_07830 [Janthinobacterium lividum]
MATKKIYYVAEGPQEAYDEAEPFIYATTGGEPATDGEAEPRCSTCGELLAWHEQVCSASTAGPAEAESASPIPKATAKTYAYDLGHLVQPVRQARAGTIIWRGQLKERHPQTGLIHRVNVYRLDDNFWDCYHEEDLQAAA